MLIDPNRIREIMLDCLFKEGEPHTEFVPAIGLNMKVGFNPVKIEQYAEEIHGILLNLPDSFQEDKGGGMSFLYMCMDKEDNQCMEQHSAQELMLLGIAAGWVKIPLPREVWGILPGGVPYVVVLKERKAVETKKYEEAS